MKLLLQRKKVFEKATIGELYVDGNFFCHTLEDVVRPIGQKVRNETAIPAGTYKVIIDMSTRFKRLMPHILDVPNFEGVRIHNGNTDAQTDGCVLVGVWNHKDKDFIGVSRDTFDHLFPALQAATDISLEIKDA